MATTTEPTSASPPTTAANTGVSAPLQAMSPQLVLTATQIMAMVATRARSGMARSPSRYLRYGLKIGHSHKLLFEPRAATREEVGGQNQEDRGGQARHEHADEANSTGHDSE